MGALSVPGQEYDMSKKELKTFTLSDEAFDKILTTFEKYVIKVEDISKYIYGSSSKVSIYYNGSNKLVCTQNTLNIVGHDFKNTWQQCICIRKAKQTDNFRPAINGGTAWRRMIALLNKYYTATEIDSCLIKYTAEYDSNKNQLHYNYTPKNIKAVHNFPNCFKYDINGAYAKALCDIFPRAEKAIMKLYLERKQKPENKELINYFVGMMCCKDYRETYNWIVQNVRQQMEETIYKVNGRLLYANTDGFIVYAPENTLETSTALGDFKLEYTGNAQIYAGDNYWAVQCGDDITGTLLHSVRNNIDLRVGKVVEYTRKKNVNVYIAENINYKEIEVINYGKEI